MKAAHLPDRAVVQVSGPDAATFLDGLATSAIADLQPGAARYAGLLSPQGKILFDFLCVRLEDETPAFALDVPLLNADALAKRLGFYKLRAKVEIARREDAAVIAFFGGAPPAGLDAIVFADPRLSGLGVRAIVPAADIEAAIAESGAEKVGPEVYHAQRIGLGVPEGARDFLYGETFPHEALMDQLGGVDFAKGCYVGQEVVSRMQHRGTARTRIVKVTTVPPAPEAGAAIEAGGIRIGTMGSRREDEDASPEGLALLRLDRYADAVAKGTPVLAGGREMTATAPAFASFAVAARPE